MNGQYNGDLFNEQCSLRSIYNVDSTLQMKVHGYVSHNSVYMDLFDTLKSHRSDIKIVVYYIIDNT